MMLFNTNPQEEKTIRCCWVSADGDDDSGFFKQLCDEWTGLKKQYQYWVKFFGKKNYGQPLIQISPKGSVVALMFLDITANDTMFEDQLSNELLHLKAFSKHFNLYLDFTLDLACFLSETQLEILHKQIHDHFYESKDSFCYVSFDPGENQLSDNNKADPLLEKTENQAELPEPVFNAEEGTVESFTENTSAKLSAEPETEPSFEETVEENQDYPMNTVTEPVEEPTFVMGDGDEVDLGPLNNTKTDEAPEIQDIESKNEAPAVENHPAHSELPSDTYPEVKVYVEATNYKKGSTGWCTILYFKGHTRELSGSTKKLTCNQALIEALMSGLRALKKKSKVQVISSVPYLTDPFTEGWFENWRKDGFSNSDDNNELWAALDKVMENHVVAFECQSNNSDEIHSKCSTIAVTESLD